MLQSILYSCLLLLFLIFVIFCRHIKFWGLYSFQKSCGWAQYTSLITQAGHNVKRYSCLEDCLSFYFISFLSFIKNQLYLHILYFDRILSLHPLSCSFEILNECLFLFPDLGFSTNVSLDRSLIFQLYVSSFIYSMNSQVWFLILSQSSWTF